jgi:hypothetical protein
MTMKMPVGPGTEPEWTTTVTRVVGSPSSMESRAKR